LEDESPTIWPHWVPRCVLWPETPTVVPTFSGHKLSTALAIANGELDVVNDAVETLTGHPAQTLEDLLTAHPESYQRQLE